MLARYSDPHGRLREILTHPGSHGSILLIDRDVVTRGDLRLLAHLAADEPPGNALFTCKDYLRSSRKRPCRALQPEDLWVAPLAAASHSDSPPEVDLLDAHGRSYRLLPRSEGIAIPELRWHRLAAAPHSDPQPLSLREVIAAFQSYQPMRDITARALCSQAPSTRLSISTLRGELQRINASPIVLNRGLREAVQRALANGDSLSEIATRCGRLKRESRGNLQGDTSWLARRIGLLPNARKSEPTPWVRSEVLALIARRGLRIAPMEVELG
ncbi:MAG TPA: hypothetical protein VID70_01755 [Solirubrobacteraceae bacterium]